MKKILHTFFFGYAPFRYRRLIRTPIVLTVLILFGYAIGNSKLDNIVYLFGNNDEIDLVYNRYIEPSPYKEALNIFHQQFSSGNLYQRDLKIKQLLKDLLETARVDNYNWEIIMSKFPEFQGIDLQLLEDYVKAARYHNYNYDIIDPRFPELFFVKLSRKEFIELIKSNDRFLYFIANQNGIKDNNEYDWRRNHLRLSSFTLSYPSVILPLMYMFFIFLVVAFISFIVEPFTRKKGDVKVLLKDTTEPISEDSITKEKPISVALDEVIENHRIPVSDNLKKVYKTVIRIVMFLVIYLSLFTIIFYAEFLLLTPVIVLVSFFLSKPLTNTLVLKWFPNLEK